MASPKHNICPDPQAEDAVRAAESLVENALSSHRVVIFAKPDCDYCVLAERTIAATISRILRAPGCAGAGTKVDAAVVTLGDSSVGQAARRMLADRTNADTLPRVFLEGECLGGATETVQYARAGMLAVALKRIAGCANGEERTSGKKALRKQFQGVHHFKYYVNGN